MAGAKMIIEVEIKSAELNVMEGIARRTGKPYKMVEQAAWVDLGKEYPQEIRFILSDQQAPYPPGRYLLDHRALVVDRNGSLAINIKALRPIASAVPGSQAQQGGVKAN